MKRFQLTIVFVLFSAMTIGSGAIAVNSLTAASAERNILRLTESQSERDARFIAKLVSQLLADNAPVEGLTPPLQGAPYELMPSPSFNTTTLQISASTVLEALDITALAIYDMSGNRLWTSSLNGTMGSNLSESSLTKVISGQTTSGIIKNAVLLPDDPANPIDLVVTFVPLIGETSGIPVQVLGVSRPVPLGVAGLLLDSRSTVMKTTMISLSGVFLILLTFVLAADVRIWKRNENAMAMEHTQQEMLGRRNEELNNLNEAKSRFISAISHELANPLSSVRAFIQLVLNNRTNNLTDQQIERLRIASRGGEQMSRLIEDLKHASRSEQDSLVIINKEFDVLSIFNEVAETQSHHLNTRQQLLKLELDPALNRMTGDRGRMVQVISNLVSNSSKYSPNGSTVRLIAKRLESNLHVEVIDEGIGITDDDQEHVFEMFWRASNPDIPGTGIGLVLAKQIVEGHGGKIRLSSALGEGTTVTFDVPLAPAVSATEVGSVDEFEIRAA